ncbi:MAG: RNA methyltransferase [Flavobacteriaceae bacterium]|nr:RNA methyltransferase [Flavobacteriaceae bacterium]
MHKIISSIHNPIIKEICLLTDKSRARKKYNRFIIEGQREISLAIEGGYQIATILFNTTITSLDAIQELFLLDHTEHIEVSSEVYQKIAYRGTTEGVIAVVQTKDLGLHNLKLEKECPLILVAEAPEKPGNIGALLRTADAANVDAVIIANPKTDLYNPNIIRSSVGCVFTNQIATGSTTEIISFLKERNVEIYCAALLEGSEVYQKQDFTPASAIVVGTEATGLSSEWLENSTKNIIIPMQGKIDSMNVSVAAGILIFEAKRQRDFK